MRPGQLAAVAAVVLVLLGDLGATMLLERRAATTLCGDPRVELRPWPVSARVLRGEPIAFAAAFDGADLEALVTLPAAVTGVEVRDGRLRLGTVAGVEVPADVELTPRSIRVTPALGPFDLSGLAIEVPLDALPTGLVLTGVTVDEATVTASGAADPTVLRDRTGPPTCPLPLS